METAPLLKSTITPLPWAQVLVLLVVRLADPLSFTVLFPFVYFLVRDFHLAATEAQVGFYVGCIASSFAVAQMLSGKCTVYMAKCRHPVGPAVGQGRAAPGHPWRAGGDVRQPADVWPEHVPPLGHRHTVHVWAAERQCGRHQVGHDGAD